ACAGFQNQDKMRERARIQLQRATDKFKLKEYGAAIEAAKAAIEEAPTMEAAHNHLALIYLETKQYDKALRSFEDALKIRPDYPEVFNNIGVLMNRQERYRDAIPWLKKAL